MSRRQLSPRQLSRQLRMDESSDLRRRRWVVGLSCVGATAGMVVGLYQMGILRRLPDLPVGPFDATKVDASDYAYKRMQTPDGLMMIATYAVTAILAGAGGKNRARDNPALPIALAAKTLYDVGVALKLAREEWADNKALCGYCQSATVASLVSAGLALPEAMEAMRHLSSGRSERRGRDARDRRSQRPATGRPWEETGPFEPRESWTPPRAMPQPAGAIHPPR